MKPLSQKLAAKKAIKLDRLCDLPTFVQEKPKRLLVKRERAVFKFMEQYVRHINIALNCYLLSLGADVDAPQGLMDELLDVIKHIDEQRVFKKTRDDENIDISLTTQGFAIITKALKIYCTDPNLIAFFTEGKPLDLTEIPGVSSETENAAKV